MIYKNRYNFINLYGKYVIITQMTENNTITKSMSSVIFAFDDSNHARTLYCIVYSSNINIL